MTVADRPRRVTVDPTAPDAAALAAPAAALAAGALVAFPTETVYGLGAHAWDAKAVARVFALKERPAADPLIVHVLDWEAALALLDPALLDPALPPAGGETVDPEPHARQEEALGPERGAGHLQPGSSDARTAPPEPLLGLAARLAAAFWPGPLTLVLPRHPALPTQVTGGGPSVALRAPAHPVARLLLQLAGVPVAAPSANRFGGISPTRAADVLAELGDGPDWLVDGGACTVGVESTVLDLRGPQPRILRPGGVSREALAALLPQGLAGPGEGIEDRSEHAASGAGDGGSSEEGAALPSPGLLSRHYAPRLARLSLYVGTPTAQREAVLAAAAAARAAGRRVALLAPAEDAALLRHALTEQAAAGDGPPVAVAVLGARSDLAAAARDLYRRLRDLDTGGVDLILALDLGTAGLGLALRDRLSRAAEGRVLRL